MPGAFGHVHATTSVGGDASGTEEPGVLVHVQRLASDGVGGEKALAEVMDEAEGGYDQRGRPGQLGSAGGRRVVFEHEKGVQGEDDGVGVGEVGFVPKLFDVAANKAG